MRAIGLTDVDAALAVIEVPTPAPADDEILVRVEASSINPIDILVAGGRYPWAPSTFPLVPGWDFAGVVEAVGAAVTRFAVGDDVFGHWSKTTFHDGSWADYLAIGEHASVAHRPAGLTPQQAAAVPLAAVTAVLAVDHVVRAPGDTVLVVGAGGAVGAYVVQLAARVGAHVIATARPGDEARVLDLGADETVDYRSQDLVEVVRARFPDGLQGLCDIVNDADEVSRLAALVVDGGRVASARFAADWRALAKRAITTANVSAADCDDAPMNRIAALLATEELQVLVDEVRPFDELPAVVAEAGRGGRGKTVISHL